MWTPVSSHSPAFKRAGLQMASAQAPKACSCGWTADKYLQPHWQPQHLLLQPSGAAVPSQTCVHVWLWAGAAVAGSLVLDLARITRLGRARQLVSARAPEWPVVQVHCTLSWPVVQVI